MMLKSIDYNNFFQSLYIHFPFCETRCHYCDFYSLDQKRVPSLEQKAFLTALNKETQVLAPFLYTSIDTLFLGGGTPSLIAPQAMQGALEPLQLDKKISKNTEWTMEANPSSINLTALKDFKKMGINRLSIGIQALKPEFLKWLGRAHSNKQALDALKAAFEAGFENVSVDLMCGIPGQTLWDIEAALKELTQFPITHLSCYLLTLAKHHPLHKELPHEEVQLEHLLFLDKWMTDFGFIHYEISNFSKPGFQAKHNLCYWKGQSYLGLGPSAHSFNAQTANRWKNISSLKKYTQILNEGNLPIEWSEKLTEEQKNLERWMLALRLEEGFSMKWLNSASLQAKATLFQNKGLLEHHPEKKEWLRLTPKGFVLSDQIIQSFAIQT